MSSIVPVGRLWFGMVDADTKIRDHFSVSEAYTLVVGNQTWLSWQHLQLPFSLVRLGVTRDFNDATEHYFKIDKNGIVALSKDRICHRRWLE